MPSSQIRSGSLPSTPSVSVLTTREAVDALEADWRALEAQTAEATGFQSFDWCRAWMDANATGRDRWRILTVRDGGQLVLVWPLQCERVLGARVLSWLGEPWTQYGDVLVAAGPRRIFHLASAWREIAAWMDIDVVKFGRVRADAAMTALPGLQGRTAFHREAAPFVELSTMRARAGDKKLRARRRKLEAYGEVRFTIVSEPGERRARAAEAVRRKQQWIRAKGVASTGLWHPALPEMMDRLAQSDTLVIGRLSVGGATAALELGLHSPGGFRSLLGCHDPRFAAGSPGHLLIAEMIGWCRSQGFGAYDLMLPADDYKRRWTDHSVEVVDHVIATKLRGRLAAAWFRHRPALKSAYAKAPGVLRRAFLVTRRS